MSLEQLIKSGAQSMGIALTDVQLSNMRAYYELLTERNKEFNLTAIKGEEDAAKLHFLDSIGILNAYDFNDKAVIDIGTGAGFPGIPLAIVNSTIDLTLVDSTEKKVEFLKEVCESLPVPAQCIHARAEELGQDWDYRQSFDICVSRAVARLNMLCELCIPLVKVGGVFIALKSSDSDEEIEEAKDAIKALGGEIENIFEYPVPESDIIRRAVVIKKHSDTKMKYPRRFGAIKKSPL
jgi:16S rRNA (guanine527-N7)-methyltransferase